MTAAAAPSARDSAPSRTKPLGAPYPTLLPPALPAYTGPMPDAKLLETFANPHPRRPYTIEHVAEEFTSLCPKTGHPDFGTVILRYGPGRTCVELKSYKLYLQSFRNQGIFYEDVTNRIAHDLIGLMKPRWLILETQWRGRGGIRSTITVSHGRQG